MSQNKDIHDMKKLIYSNISEFFLNLGKLHGDEVKETSSIKYVFTAEWENRIFVEDFQEKDIKKLINIIERPKIPPKLYIPTPYYSYLTQVLKKYNFSKTKTTDWIGMGIDLEIIPEDYEKPLNLEIKEIYTDPDLDKWINVLISSYNIPDNRIKSYKEYFSTVGINSLYNYYLVELNKKPVSTAILYPGNNVSGIYYLGTIPQARRKGISRALMYHVLHEARNRGYKHSVLGATEIGAKLYENIGFKEYYHTDIYEWDK